MTKNPLTKDGKPALSLEAWCERQGIHPSNARSYYIPRERIPGIFKIGADWWVPESSSLIRKERVVSAKPKPKR